MQLCYACCMPLLQFFLEHDSEGNKRPEPWTADLLTTDGRHAAAKCLQWLLEGAPGYQAASKAGRKAKDGLVSCSCCCSLSLGCCHADISVATLV